MSTKTVFVHIGAHKTATTYLQALMLKNKQVLKEINIDYLGRCTSNSHAPGESIPKAVHLYLDSFINNSTIENIIISDEDLCHNRNNICVEFVRRYRRKARIKVICYVREIVSYYTSFYTFASMYLSDSSLEPKYSSFIEYLDRQKAYASTHHLLLELIDIIGRNNVVVRPFERRLFHNGSIESDFFGIIGCNNYRFQGVSIQNASISLKIAEKLYYALSLTRDIAVRRIVKDRILRDHSDAHEDASTITVAELDEIYARYRSYEEKNIELFFGNNKYVFDKQYTHWRSKIEASSLDRFLGPSEKKYIFELVYSAQEEITRQARNKC
ncbi:hypothetical protein [Methyloceanibacter sp. wino2]|uniref:hypothetical protein n=1 Tax=Methyloceanibacter sp. wino2 TaxID=2170729 RepID=UPI00131F0CDF|nr:hypothetical protein [Methyloceanibacter sp. wino2]